MVRVDDVVVVPGHNARKTFDEPALLQLSGSIAANGLIQPVVLVQSAKELQLVAGERRLRAAKLAGEEYVEARVYKNLSQRQIASMALAENFARADLNHIETAEAMGTSRDAGASIAEIAAEVHKSTDYVRKHLDLLRLCEPVRMLVVSGRLPAKQAELIARVGDPQQQIGLGEDATRLEWRGDGGWKPEIKYRDEKRPDRQGVDDRDYVVPVDKLRGDIASIMLALASCGWPRDEKYADRRPCEDCPDNTATYADQPMLFEGHEPRGSAKKGHCTNEVCYRAKEKAWAKVREARKKAKAKKLEERIADAKAKGVDVCERCGKIGDGELVDRAGQLLCAKCVKKANRAFGDGRRDEGWEAREKRVAKLKRAFPSTIEERYAKALHDYGRALAKAIEKRLTEPPLPTGAVEIVLLADLLSVSGWLLPGVRKTLPSMADLVGGESFSPKALASLWKMVNDADREAPEGSYAGSIKNVPLADEHVAYIDDLEVLANHWEIADLPGRPELQAIAWKAAMTVIVKGKRPDAVKAIGECTDEGLLQGILNSTPVTCPDLPKKIATWRVKAVMARVAELHRQARLSPARRFLAVMARVAELHPDSEAKEKAHPEGKAEQPEPRYTTGTCRFCGCTDEHGCPEGCSWADDEMTLCTTCEERLERITKSKKPDAMDAISYADHRHLGLLIHASNTGLTGDWRRAAVSKRIEELKKSS